MKHNTQDRPVGITGVALAKAGAFLEDTFGLFPGQGSGYVEAMLAIIAENTAPLGADDTHKPSAPAL